MVIIIMRNRAGELVTTEHPLMQNNIKEDLVLFNELINELLTDDNSLESVFLHLTEGSS